MNISLVFNNSGDQIDISATQPEVAEFYINWLNETNTNTFTNCANIGTFELHDRIQALNHFKEMVPYFSERFNILCYDGIDLDNEPFDQDKINKIHRCFVKSLMQTEPNIVGELSKEPEMLDKFRMLNQGCHYIERNWKVKMKNNGFSEPDFIQPISNPFGDITTFDVCNLSIQYAGLGRQTYNKWEHSDYNIDDIDTHNFEELYGVIEFNLLKPHTVAPPPEYTAYCKEHNMVPYGTHISLGNVKNLDENSGKYRDILHRNISVQNNSMRLEYEL